MTRQESTELPHDYVYEELCKKTRCKIITKQNRVCKLSAKDERGICYIHLNSNLSHGRTDKYVPYEKLGHVYYYSRITPTKGLDLERFLQTHSSLNTTTSPMFITLITEIDTIINMSDRCNKVLQLVENIPKAIPYLEDIKTELVQFHKQYRPGYYSSLIEKYLVFIKFYYLCTDLCACMITYGQFTQNIRTYYATISQVQRLLFNVRKKIEQKLYVCKQIERILCLPSDIIYYCIYGYMEI